MLMHVVMPDAMCAAYLYSAILCVLVAGRIQVLAVFTQDDMRALVMFSCIMFGVYVVRGMAWHGMACVTCDVAHTMHHIVMSCTCHQMVLLMPFVVRWVHREKCTTNHSSIMVSDAHVPCCEQVTHACIVCICMSVLCVLSSNCRCSRLISSRMPVPMCMSCDVM